MKKIVVSVAVLCMFAATASAKKVADATPFDVEINVNKLDQYLGLNADQRSEVIDITSYFQSQMSRAKYAKSEKQPERLKIAVYGNLKLMKETLNNEQYTKYLRLINTTFRNNGLDAMLIAAN